MTPKEKYGITGYANAFLGRYKNRRLTVYDKEQSDGIVIEFQTTAKDNKRRASHKYERGRITTTIALSEDAAEILFGCLLHRFEKKHKQQTK